MPKNTVDQFAELSSVIVRALPRDLPPADMQYWILHQAELAQVLDRAMRRNIPDVSEFFTLVSGQDQALEKHEALFNGWRSLASEIGGSLVIMLVKAGFTLKHHVPQLEPSFKAMEKWSFEDKPTQNCIVFWISRLVGLGKRSVDQLRFLNTLLHKHGLPKVRGFGEASLIAGLILARVRDTGGWTPLNHCWVRTDTPNSGGNQLILGNSDGDSLSCDHWSYSRVIDNMGVFPLGVVLGP